MDIRTAILKAADHIERNPDSFRYSANSKPDCGTPGCMLGWIGIYMGVTTHFPGAFVCDVAAAISTSLGAFIQRTRDIREGNAWYYDCSTPQLLAAANAANVMRAYADKYHPAAKQDLPASVRHIFDMSPGELAEALSA